MEPRRSKSVIGPPEGSSRDGSPQSPRSEYVRTNSFRNPDAFYKVRAKYPGGLMGIRRVPSATDDTTPPLPPSITSSASFIQLKSDHPSYNRSFSAPDFKALALAENALKPASEEEKTEEKLIGKDETPNDVRKLKELVFVLRESQKKQIDMYETLLREIPSPCKEHSEMIKSLHKQVLELQQENLTLRLNSRKKDPTPLTPPTKRSEQRNTVMTVRHHEPAVARFLKIRCEDLTFTTKVNTNTFIRYLIKKLQIRFPNETTNYHLYLKVKNTFVLLDDDKQFSSYKQIEDAAEDLTLDMEFASSTMIEAMVSAQMMHSDRSKEREFNAKSRSVPPQVFLDAITRQDVAALNTLMESGVFYTEEYDASGQTPLHSVIRDFSLSVHVVESFLKFFHRMGRSINIPDSQGWTALHIAVSNGTGTDNDEEITKLLLDFPGINARSENRDGNTVLHFFCQKFLNPSCTAIGQRIIKLAPEMVNTRNRNGETPLHKAMFNDRVRLLMVKLLVSNGADVNIINTARGETALHYAARLGRKDLVKLLLHSGADIHIREVKDNRTALELAQANQQTDTAEMLKDVEELESWLISIGVGDLFMTFVREELTLPVLVQADPESIVSVLDLLKVDSEEKKTLIIDAIPKLRDDLGKRAFEAQIRKAQKTSGAELGRSNETEAGILKQSLNQLVDNAVERWLINHHDCEFTKELGEGTSGRVFKGLYKGQAVAIKVLKVIDQKNMKDFKKEFHAMSFLRSQHIVQFVGACLYPKICMVMEYCAKGSLYELLNEESEVVTWNTMINFSIAMCKGMMILHKNNPQILHRDLKSLNLLVTKSNEIKIADFGLARFATGTNKDTLSKTVGTYTYMAPEMFYGKGAFTEKSDVFSMGIILWEMCERVINNKYMEPYHELNLGLGFQILYQVAEKGARPTFSKGYEEKMKTLITSCWDVEPENRPDVETMLASLEDIQYVYLPLTMTRYDNVV